MDKKTKYILIGIVIGIAIGILLFYLLMSSGIIRPYGFREFMRPENFTNATRHFNPPGG
ncbi:MAG: hypothetical protein V1900_02035 [Candidatus Aenigmatarchaeota archaeon]